MNAGYVQLRAALDGSFEYEIEAARGNVVYALGLSMEELADELVGKLGHDFVSSGLRNAGRLKGAAWRRKLYGKGRSLEPSAWIFSKIPLIIQAFENGQTIRAKGGSGSLLIPNPDVWPNGRVRRGSRGMTLGSLWAVAEARFGPLHMVRRPGRTTIVVAQVRESAARPGTFRKASATALRRQAAGKVVPLVSVVVFIVAREVTQERRLRGAEIRRRAQRDAPRRMETLFLKYFADVDRGGQRRLPNHYVRPTPGPSGFTRGSG